VEIGVAGRYLFSLAAVFLWGSPENSTHTLATADSQEHIVLALALYALSTSSLLTQSKSLIGIIIILTSNLNIFMQKRIFT
jgi:hypothetical protein